MNKEQFLAELQKGLSGLPQAEIDDRLAFYGEFIDDHMEEGMTEEEAKSLVKEAEPKTPALFGGGE